MHYLSKRYFFYSFEKISLRQYIYSFFLLGFLFISGVFSQTLNIHIYNVEQGLVQSQVQTILQDKKGYLWIGTVDGLSKFDGINFVSYTRFNGLADNDITASRMDKNGNIWFGHTNGKITRYNASRDKFEIISLQPDSTQKTIQEISQIFFDHQDGLWITTLGDGIIYSRGDSLRFFSENDGLSDNQVYAVCYGPDSTLWFGTINGISVYQPERKDSTHIFHSLPVKGELSSAIILSLLQDSNGNIWIGTQEQGLFRYIPPARGTGGAIIQKYSKKDGLENTDILALFQDRQGVIWAGTYGGGVSKFIPPSRTGQRGHFQTITTRNGLSRNYIFSIYQDREGTYWFGTNGGGICQFRDDGYNIITEKDGLSDKVVWSIAEDLSGNMWIGTDNGLTKFSPPASATGRAKSTIFRQARGVPIGSVQKIIRDSRGNIWFISFGEGLFRVNPVTNKFRAFTTKDGLSTGNLLSLNEDKQGNIWIGSFNRGVFQYQPEQSKFVHFDSLAGMPVTMVNTIFKDRSGNLWFSTDKAGLIKYDGNSFSPAFPLTKSQEHAIISLSEDREGNLWLVTFNGELLKFNGKQIFNFSRHIHLETEPFYSVICDDSNNVWLGTIHGIVKLNLRDTTLSTLGKAEGYPVMETNQDAVYKDLKGNIWFGTINGVIRYESNKRTPVLTPPPIYLTKLRVFLKDAAFPPKNQFPYSQNHLTFYFHGISLSAPQKIRYRYRLDGFDTNWSPLTEENRATYSNLPPGRYTFRTQARNLDGVWSKTPAKYSFEILTPFWQSWWFILLVILSLLALIYLIYKNRVKKIEKDRVRLGEKVKERTFELLKEKEKVEKAYKALQESEEKFRALTETTASAIFIYQGPSFIYVNPATETLTGFSREELLQVNFWDVVHPEYRELVKNRGIARQKKQQVPMRYEFKLLTKSGEERWIDFSARHIIFNGEAAALGTAFDITSRKELEEERRKLSKAVETAPMAVVLINAEGKIEYVNQGFLSLCGLRVKNAVIDTSFFDLTDAPGKAKLKNEIIPQLLSGKDTNCEIQIQREDGSFFPAELICSLVTQEKKQSPRILIHFQNIEIRKKQEQTLRDSEMSYRGLFNSIPDAIYIQDRQGRFLDVNEGAMKMNGYTREELVGNTPEILALPGKVDMETTFGYLQEAFKGKPQVFEWWGVRKNGEAFPKEVVLTKSQYFGQEVVLAIARDITEQKKAAQLLEQEKERLAVTLRSIGDGVITTDTDGRVVLLNRVAEELCGWLQQESVGKPLSEILKIKDGKTGQVGVHPVVDVLKTGEIFQSTGQHTLIARNRSERFIWLSAAPIRTRDNQIIGLVLVLRDITEIKKMEQELLKAQKIESVGILAGGIAHDFNNILSAILGNVSLAKIYAESDEKISKRLTEAEKATMRAKDLTQQLLTFSKGGAPVKETTSITEIIRESVDFTLRGSSVDCKYSFPENLWAVEVDTGQMSQVIQNLVINAQQAMPEGGIIEIGVQNESLKKNSGIPLPTGKYIKISISDHGVGISAEHLSRIFDPYFTTKHQGNGLGLATAYSIIKKHNGHIYADSVMGKGSTFTIYLPAKAVKIAHRQWENNSIKKGKGKILIVDDEEAVREIVSQILNDLGYTVTTATSGEEAIRIYSEEFNQSKPFNLVIMDLTLPGGIGGTTAIQKIHDLDPDVKAVVASGYSSDPVMAHFADYGFAGCIKKPFTVKEISSVVSELLSE
ncbi:MAG TPA: PAS domain S-box protein [Caldithrix sp.]|nr:PAS domain S-box protein [Caldithrix sp.]